MAYKKRKIPASIQEVQKRIAGMKSIDPKLDLGNGVSVDTMEAAVETVVAGIEDYNTTLSSLDGKGNTIDANIKTAVELSTRALKGGEFKYGKNSDEYEKFGGTRSSERKKPDRKDKKTS